MAVNVAELRYESYAEKEKKVSRGLREGSLRLKRTVAHEEFIPDRLVRQQKVYSVDIRILHTIISYMLGHRLE